MDACESCGNPLGRVLGLVKDGTVYEAYRCAEGHHILIDTRQSDIPIHCRVTDGVPITKVQCVENCYIFDKAIMKTALKKVLDFSRQQPSDLVLDLSAVSFVSRPHLNALRRLYEDLRDRGLRLVVVSGSAVVAREACSAVPALQGWIVGRESQALSLVGRAGEAQVAL